MHRTNAPTCGKCNEDFVTRNSGVLHPELLKRSFGSCHVILVNTRSVLVRNRTTSTPRYIILQDLSVCPDSL